MSQLLRSLPTEYVYATGKDILNQDVYTFLLVSPKTFALTGYQEYRPAGSKTLNSRQEGKLDKNGNKIFREYMRYYTYNRKNEMRCWVPSYKLYSEAMKRGYIFVGEGIFSIAPLAQLREPCVALLTSDNKPVVEYLRSQGLRLLGFVDGDKAGHALGKQLDAVYNLPEGKDLDDCYNEQGLFWIYDRVQELVTGKVKKEPSYDF